MQPTRKCACSRRRSFRVSERVTRDAYSREPTAFAHHAVGFNFISIALTRTRTIGQPRPRPTTARCVATPDGVTRTKVHHATIELEQKLAPLDSFQLATLG